MIEPLVFQPNANAGPTDDVLVNREVIEMVGRTPVRIRGGGKTSDQEILERTEVPMKQGAAGIGYGRNISHDGNPAGMTRASMAVVHPGATAAEAAK